MLDRRQGLTGALALAGLSVAGRRAQAAAGPAVVALFEQRDRFLVEVAINGAGGYRFVLDTGASTHFISARVAEQLNLPEVDRRMTRGYNGRGPESVVGLSSLTVGGVALGRANLDVWPSERLENHDGLIGYPFLFPRAVLNLGNGEISLGGRASDAMAPVAARVMRNQTLLIGGVGGVEGRFLFDTGAQSCTITPGYLRRIAGTGAFQAAAKFGRRNADGETEIAGFRPEELAFGAFRIASPNIRVAPAADSGSVFDDVDGLFGVSLIKPYAWALDQTTRSLRAGPMTPA